MPELASPLELVCVSTHDESADVRTFTFERGDGQAFSYRAGQFVTIAPQIGATAVRRCYTLSSSPDTAGGSRLASITVKAKPGGLVSNWLHANLRPGMRLAALPPAGAFAIGDRRPERYLFVAGGVGITPLVSMARWLLSTAADATPDSAAARPDICFVQCARSDQDLLFMREIEHWASRRLLDARSLPATATADWRGERGLISRDYLDALCPDWAARRIYCCGPDGFMHHVRAMALRAGHAPERYHEERFTIDDTAPSAAPAPAGTAQASPLLLRLSGRRIDDTAGMTLLEAARTVGVQIPASCEIGLCGTCKVKVHAGQVDQQHQGGIGDEEIEAGWTLACCSRAIGPVEIGA